MESDPAQTPASGEYAILEKKFEKLKKLGKNRGVETLMRNTYRVHIALNTLADSKANFLISVNSVIMVVVSSHGMTYVTSRLLFIPMAVLIATCVSSMVFAVLCARPRVDHDKFARRPDGGTDGNLLFFGSFTQLSKTEFREELLDVLREGEKVYPTMLDDLYQMGQVLDKKFGRLKTAYAILLFGMPIGVILFVVMQSIIKAGTIQ
jgi:hypothetical protein